MPPPTNMLILYTPAHAYTKAGKY